MSKRKSIKRYVFTAIACVVGIILCIGGFDIPFTNYKFNGFVNSINLGIDLKGGLAVVYNTNQLDEGDYNEQLNATVERISDLISSKGYSEATVTKQGGTQIRIEVPNIDEPEVLLSIIETSDVLEIKTTEDGEAELTGEHIVNAAYNGTNGYGVTLEFDEEGAKIFKDLTTNNSTLYLTLGDTNLSLPVEGAITDGKTSFYGFQSKSEAENFALKVLSATYPLQLVQESVSNIVPTLGENTLTYSLIAGGVALLIIFVLMFVLYGELGLIADLVLVIYTILLFFFLQAVPFVQLTLPGIAGIILSLGMAVDANIIICERIKEEYKLGKKIPAAFKSGFKRSISAIFDSNIITLIVSIVLMLLGTGPIKGFATVLLVGIAISLFTSLVIARSLINLYLPLNSTNAKKLRLSREENVDELK